MIRKTNAPVTGTWERPSRLHIEYAFLALICNFAYHLAESKPESDPGDDLEVEKSAFALPTNLNNGVDSADHTSKTRPNLENDMGRAPIFGRSPSRNGRSSEYRFRAHADTWHNPIATQAPSYWR